jgi:hypothetical protein
LEGQKGKKPTGYNTFMDKARNDPFLRAQLFDGQGGSGWKRNKKPNKMLKCSKRPIIFRPKLWQLKK